MTIIYSGLGFFVVIIGFVSVFVTQLAVDKYMGSRTYSQTHVWPMFLGTFVAAVMVWFWGRALNKPYSRPRKVFDPHTREIVLKTAWKPHALFFVPMEYWAPIMLLIASVVAIRN